MTSSVLFLWPLVSQLVFSPTEAYSILGIFLFPAKSHYAVIEPIMTELANRGHRVTEYSPFVRPPSSLPKNFVHVDVSQCFHMPDRQLTVDYLLSISSGTYRAMSALFNFVPDYRTIARCPPMMELLSNRTAAANNFDLVITEVFNSEISLIVPYKLGIPFVQVLFTPVFLWRIGHTGNPNWPSYMPLATESYGGSLMNGFFERLRNTLATCMADAMYDRLSTARTDDAAKKLLGLGTPSVKEIAKNSSLTFMFTHAGYNDAVRPLLPSTIDISGLTIKAANPLPTDIKKFIDESEHGVVYFCLGSLIKTSSFPENKLNAFLYAFSKIPQRILWKWESDVLPGKTSNIMIAKWMPQRDILAHPKVKLFISHGGLLSTSEAIHEGVPILGMPIFGDQRTNVKSIKASGAGEMLDYNEISEQLVLQKINRLLTDPKYRKNAQELSRRYRDRPMSPLDTAIYWTEYVIRHNGAYHLRSASVDMPWYQYFLLDVITFTIFILVIFLIAVYFILKLALRFVLSKFTEKAKIKAN